MFDAVRKVVLTLAATLIGAGNAACACAPVSSSAAQASHVACDTPRPETPAHGAHGGMHHKTGDPTSHPADSDKSPPPDHSQCSHCNLAAVGASSAVDDGVVAAFANIYKAASAAITPALPDFARSEVAPEGRWRWRAPPIATPVALKIRLRQ